MFSIIGLFCELGIKKKSHSYNMHSYIPHYLCIYGSSVKKSIRAIQLQKLAFSTAGRQTDKLYVKLEDVSC